MKTIFSTKPILEAKNDLYKIIDDVMVIVSDRNMAKAIDECFGKLEIPEGKNLRDFYNEIDGNGRICNFVKYVMDYALEPLIRVLSVVFCTPFEKYSKKSINAISKDLIKFSKSPFFAFFTSAIMSGIKVK